MYNGWALGPRACRGVPDGVKGEDPEALEYGSVFDVTVG